MRGTDNRGAVRSERRWEEVRGSERTNKRNRSEIRYFVGGNKA